MSAKFALDWHGGPSVAIDVEATADPQDVRYRRKYSSPFRATMRPPSDDLAIGPVELDWVRQRLKDFAQSVGYGDSRGPSPGAGQPDPGLDALIDIGRNLFQFVLPRYVVADLSGKDMFLEIGTDESLLHYPWELLHDGNDFLSLKHFMGRFVNQRQVPSGAQPRYTYGADLDELKVLIISVPAPPGFDRLHGAQDEAEAIVDELKGAGIQPQYLGNATRDEVLHALLHPYHIIHFTGHALFRPQAPRESALVLRDGNLTVGMITTKMAYEPSVLCFVNGCETTAGGQGQAGAVAGGGWDEQYDLFGLARGFLESGAYVLGTRWKLPDQAGKTFAKVFYRELLGGVPIGRAITEARRTLKDSAGPGDYSWASYVYYGDPRVCFHKVEVAATAAAVAGMEMDAGRTEQGVPEVKPVSASARADLGALAQEYERVRDTVSGQTVQRSKIVSEAAGLAIESDTGLVTELKRGGDGERIVALALLQARPDPHAIEFLIEVIEHPRSDVEQSLALQAAKLLGTAIPEDWKDELVRALKNQAEQAWVVGTDRQLLINQILAGLGITTS